MKHRSFVNKFLLNLFFALSNSFEQSDGQSRQEEAVINNLGSDNESLSVQGSFSFVSDDGQTYTVSYIADENGRKLHNRMVI